LILCRLSILFEPWQRALRSTSHSPNFYYLQKVNQKYRLGYEASVFLAIRPTVEFFNQQQITA